MSLTSVPLGLHISLFLSLSLCVFLLQGSLRESSLSKGQQGHQQLQAGATIVEKESLFQMFHPKSQA